MMTTMNNGMSTIHAAGMNIIKRYDDAELVAVLHASGAVAVYAEEDGMLLQISSMHRSTKLSAVELADSIMGLAS